MLYRAVNNDFQNQLKIAAAAQGADVDWDDDWYDPAPPPEKKAATAIDIAQFPAGLGYEVSS